MTIPNLRVPFFFAEFDSSKASTGPSILDYQVLVIGQKLSSGTKTPLQVDLVSSEDQASNFYGAGSQLHRMAEFYFKNNKVTKTFFIAMDDDGGAAASTGSVAFTGTATGNGTIFLYIGGRRFTLGVSTGDTATTIAANLNSLINALLKSPVTSSPTSGTIDLTAKNKGEAGNEIDIRLNYFSGEELPLGISAIVTPMAGGTVNPNIQDVIDVIGEEWYNIIVSPYNDASNLTKIETELEDRFGPIRQIDGVYFTSKRGTLGSLVSFGTGRNSKHVSIMHSEKIPNTSEEFAAANAAVHALEGQADPARPFQTLTLTGILPPATTEKFDLLENDQLLRSGISTFMVDSGGNVRVQRSITMYQKNVQGAPDIAFLNVNTPLTLMFLRFDFRNQFLTTFPRAKLGVDGEIQPSGQQIITPNIAKTKAISIFRGWQVLGLVENIDQFKKDLVVEVNPSDPDRLDFLLSPDLINQFRVGAATFQFLLKAPT